MQQLNYNNEERCFLCDPCRVVISGTILELRFVEFSQSEEQELDAKWLQAWESVMRYSPAVKDVSTGHC
jgi:hypothetical protein